MRYISNSGFSNYCPDPCLIWSWTVHWNVQYDFFFIFYFQSRRGVLHHSVLIDLFQASFFLLFVLVSIKLAALLCSMRKIAYRAALHCVLINTPSNSPWEGGCYARCFVVAVCTRKYLRSKKIVSRRDSKRCTVPWLIVGVTLSVYVWMKSMCVVLGWVSSEVDKRYEGGEAGKWGSKRHLTKSQGACVREVLRGIRAVPIRLVSLFISASVDGKTQAAAMSLGFESPLTWTSNWLSGLKRPGLGICAALSQRS